MLKYQEDVINKVYIPEFYDNSPEKRKEYRKLVAGLNTPEKNKIGSHFFCKYKQSCSISRGLWRGQEFYCGSNYGKENIRVGVIPLEPPLGVKSKNTELLSEELNNLSKREKHWGFTLKSVQKIIFYFYGKNIEFNEVQKYFVMLHSRKCYPERKGDWSDPVKEKFTRSCSYILEKEIKVLNPEIVYVQSFVVKRNSVFLKNCKLVKQIFVKGHQKNQTIESPLELLSDGKRYYLISDYFRRVYASGINEQALWKGFEKILKGIKK